MSKDKRRKSRRQAASPDKAKALSLYGHPDVKLFTAMGEMRGAEACLRYWPADDDEVETFNERSCHPHVETIIETLAHTPAGVRVKLNLLNDWASLDMEPPQSISKRLAKAIDNDLRDMEARRPPPRQPDIRPDLKWLVGDLRNPHPDTPAGIADDRREIADRIASVLKGGAS